MHGGAAMAAGREVNGIKGSTQTMAGSLNPGHGGTVASFGLHAVQVEGSTRPQGGNAGIEQGFSAMGQDDEDAVKRPR